MAQARSAEGATQRADAGQQESDRQLGASLRELVGKEVQRQGAPGAASGGTAVAALTGASLPHWKEALWLAVFIGDVVLVYTWFSEALKGPLEFLDKFLPWMFGGLFVVATDWLRKRLLAISRARRYRLPLLAFLVLGISLGYNVIPFRTEVSPPGTVLSIDGEARGYEDRIGLSLKTHEVVISKGEDDRMAPKDRHFTLGWWRVVGAALFKSLRPDWRLIYSLDIDAPAPGPVTITMQDGRFDSQFLEDLRPPLSKKSDTMLEFKATGPKRTDEIQLPAGKYSIVMAGCAPQEVALGSQTRNVCGCSKCKTK